RRSFSVTSRFYTVSPSFWGSQRGSTLTGVRSTRSLSDFVMRPQVQVHRDMLPNGLMVVTVPVPHLHTASIVMYARVGSRYETPKTNGLSHFLEHMLFRGSKSHPNSLALNYAIEEIGGTLYAETGRDYSLYQISLHPENLPRGVEIFGDIFDAPSLTDIDLERKIILAEIPQDIHQHR